MRKSIMVICLVVVLSFTTWQLIETIRSSSVTTSLSIKDSTEKDILSQVLTWNSRFKMTTTVNGKQLFYGNSLPTLSYY